MSALTVNVVLEDTYANLKAGEPYGSDYYDQLVRATDFDNIYRISIAGLMVGTFKPSGSIQYDLTTASVLVPSLPESPTYIKIFRDGQFLFPTEYSIPAGGGQVDFTNALVDESVYIEFVP